MGGTKRKIPIEKIEKKEARSVAFSKRRDGLYRKASELCLLFGARVAILASPPSNKSNVSFYSFGHSSVDEVIDAFLENRCPNSVVADSPSVFCDQALQPLKQESKDDNSRGKNSSCLLGKKPCLGLGFWWEEEEFDKYEHAKDLRDVIKGMVRLKNNVTLRLNTMKNQTLSRDTEMLASVSHFVENRFGSEYLQDFQIQGFHGESPNNVVTIAGQNNLRRYNNDAGVEVKSENEFLSMMRFEDSPTTNPVFPSEDNTDLEEIQATPDASASNGGLDESPKTDFNLDDFFSQFTMDKAQGFRDY